MRVRSGRAFAACVALLATVVLTSFQSPPDAEAHVPGLDRFLYALGQVESGGNYYAVNPTSGAYGKYQIMPSNWPPWARTYIGSSSAPQTPRNQEVVARGKVHDLYHWLQGWRRVAYWWLTGSSKTTGWSDYATRYVDKVIRIYRSADTSTSTTDFRRYSENSRRITYTGSWIRAEHSSYRGDAVRQAKRKGQTATFLFTGSKVAWNGPKGPTRGKARVYIDGQRVKTVDLYATRFSGRNRIFTWGFPASGAHTLVIEVLGTSGRPVVAIDEFVVWY